MSLPLSHATLLIRIPRIGPEMRVGFNCAALEQTADGLLIRSPLIDNGTPCGYDVLVTSWGFSKLAHDAEPPTATGPKFSCPHCSAGFTTSQARGSHITKKHGGEK